MSGKASDIKKDPALDRDRIVIRTSAAAIVTNVVLSGFKAAVGLASGSIAIVLDAVNGFSDALSSAITIAGTVLAAKKPDKKHPMGYGRIEYMTAMVVAALILYAGITSLVESVKKIAAPEPAEYTAISLIVLGAAVVVKLILGLYIKRQGQRAGSASLAATGTEALFDVLLSLSVLASVVVFMAAGISLEAWVGLLLSGFIIKAGVEALLDTANDLLGRREDRELTRHVRQLVAAHEGVHGAYDLFVTDYGPNRKYASVHIEVDDTMTAEELDRLTRQITADVYGQTGVFITGLGVYARNTKEGRAAEIERAVREAVGAHGWAKELHGFYLDEAAKNIRLDVVFTFDIDPNEGIAVLTDELKSLCPGYAVSISPDVDLTD